MLKYHIGIASIPFTNWKFRTILYESENEKKVCHYEPAQKEMV